MTGLSDPALGNMHGAYAGGRGVLPSAVAASGGAAGPLSSQNCSNRTWPEPEGAPGARSNVCTNVNIINVRIEIDTKRGVCWLFLSLLPFAFQ